MNNSILSDAILDFMTIVEQCLLSTTYTQDRLYYEKDLAYTSKWLIALHNRNSESEVVNDVLDNSTSKLFYDIYKQGDWGAIESSAFQTLQTFVSENYKK